MNKLSGTLLAVLFLVVANAWGGCFAVYNNNKFSIGTSQICDCNGACATSYVCGPCPSSYDRTSDPVRPYIYINGVNETASNIRCSSTPSSCAANSMNLVCTFSMACDTKCESDSVLCIQGGSSWIYTGASTCDGKSCKMSNCLQSDTLWLNDSKAACDAIGGENNYAITDIDETCVHSGICCPSDSALVGNTCKWRCDSLYTACNAKNGYLYAGVLQDTTISGADSIFTNKCYYNCSYAYNKDSTTSVTDGNTACSSPSTPIADCTRMPNDFSSVRTTYGDSVYSYDFLTPGSAAYIDSIVLTPCSRFMYRCTVNGKYKYWYSDADIPTGCTNIVKIK